MRSVINNIIVVVTISVLSACSGQQAPNSDQAAKDSAPAQKVVLAGSRLKQPANAAQPDVHTGTSVQGAGGW